MDKKTIIKKIEKALVEASLFSPENPLWLKFAGRDLRRCLEKEGLTVVAKEDRQESSK